MIILMLILILFNSLGNFSIGAVQALQENFYFARVMADNVMLYKNPFETDDYANIYFEIPKTFFVKLLDSYDSTFYHVEYIDIKGYVKKDSVTAIIGSPKMPYLNNLSLRIYSDQSRDMRKMPTNSGGIENQVSYLPLYTQNLTFYGKVAGESVIEERTNVWFYCKYSGDSVCYGYVYSDFCDDGAGNSISIPINSEEVAYTTNPDFSYTKEETALPVESKTTLIVIAILCVPALIFVLMFLKGAKFSKTSKVQNKEVKDY